MLKPNKTNQKAIVIGASMAGLLTARVLADHFAEVTLLERDAFPAPGENRKGVPQGQHTHILLERGREIMEAYLPGLTDDLMALSAVRITDASRDVRWFQQGGYHQPGISEVPGLGVSRPTLEAAVRARVLALSNVRALENVDVRSLEATIDKGRVTGVYLMNRGENGRSQTLTADLVVDASGRGSRSPAWLAELGYQRPNEEEVRIGMGYTTCYFRRRPEHIPGLEGITLTETPPDKHLGVLIAQDNNRWVLTLGGYLGEHAPTDMAGFLAAAKRLPAADIYEVVKNAEPLGEPVAFKVPANLRRRYDKLDPFPEGYLVIGDALCSFNPIYAQGMTVAALEAEALEDCLRNGRSQLARRFFTKAYKIINSAWQTVVGADLNIPEIEGPRTPMSRFLNWYIGKLHIAAQSDAQVSIAFLKVINMLAPPPSMMHPRILWRVLRGNWGARASAKPSRLPLPERTLSHS